MFFHMFPYDLLWKRGVLNIQPWTQLRVHVLHACCGSHSQHARDHSSSEPRGLQRQTGRLGELNDSEQNSHRTGGQAQRQME